jgi:hypothetical protein
MIGSLKQCHGPLPGLPADDYGSCPLVLQTFEEASRSESFRFKRSDGPCSPPTDTLLEVGQKLTLTGNDTTTCVVGADDLVACIDGNNRHGFVLQRSGSWVF